jgi:hypothetical protein
MNDFDAALQTHLEGCQKIINETFDVCFPNNRVTQLTTRHGKRYVKIIRDGESVFSFIDKTNGDVLKAASWSSPAKGARGNIFDKRNGLSRMQWTGPDYNR